MMKIVTVVGARPQLVKAAVVSRIIASHDGMEEVLVHTGQHFSGNMSDVFFREMEIPEPKHHLGVHSLPHGAMTGRMLEGIEKVLTDEQPDFLLVYGDTNSTIAGALAARKMFIPVVHVEAGLRSHNMRMPEEINRILTDRISDILCCPTETAVRNLHAEGFERFPCVISRTGDVMQDAAMYYAEKAAGRSGIMKEIGDDPFILCTLHRQENTDDAARLKDILEGLRTVHEKKRVIMPLHPRTAKVTATLGVKVPVNTIDPVGYLDMIELIRHSDLVITDSGGLQKEAFFFGKHCITMRDETEWTELVEHGYNKLSGTTPDGIRGAVEEMSGRESDFNIDLYGQGRAGERIAALLEKASAKS